MNNVHKVRYTIRIRIRVRMRTLIGRTVNLHFLLWSAVRPSVVRLSVCPSVVRLSSAIVVKFFTFTHTLFPYAPPLNSIWQAPIAKEEAQQREPQTNKHTRLRSR